MYAQIGDIVLSGAFGFQSFSSEKAGNVVEHALIDGKPKLQKIGNELEKINFTLSLHASFTDIDVQISKFNDLVDNSTPVPITLGSGEYLGYYVLTKVKKSVEQTDANGQVIKCELEISLVEYTSEILNQTNSFAVSTSGVVPVSSVTPSIPIAGMISTQITDCNNLSNEINSDLKQAGNNSSKKNKSFTNAMRRIRNIDDKLSNAYIIASNVFLYINEANNLKQRITLTKKSLQALKGFCEVRDIEGARNANVSFQDSMNKTSNLASVFTQQYALRRSV